MRRLRRTLRSLLAMVGLVVVARWLVLRLRQIALELTDDTTPPIEPEQVRPGVRRIIVSDLHWGAGDRLDDFVSDDAFIAFVRSYVITPEPTELILAGDTFEFLQVRLPHLGDYEWSGAAAAERLRVILSAHAGCVAALRDFIAQPDNQLTLLIGNHDFELHYAAAKQTLRAALGVADDAPQVRFGLRYEGDGIYLEHGNQFDEWNQFVHFEGISTPFEVVRGTRIVKDVINPMEDDPLDVAPLIDNVKPTRAFLWYLLSLPRLRQAESRRFVARGLLRMFRSVALPTTYRRPVLTVREELLDDSAASVEQEAALQAMYVISPEMRQAAAARHGGVEPEVHARSERLAAMRQAVSHWLHRGNSETAALEQIEREAEQQLVQEIRGFKGIFVQAMANIAASEARRHNTLFVCGHTHLPHVVALSDRQMYVNVGTWTEVIRQMSDDPHGQQQLPFLEVRYPHAGAPPQGQLLTWQGHDAPPQPWSSAGEAGDNATT